LLLDAGHVCQNLYLAVEALGLGTCAIGAYDQAAMDTLLELDGEDEYVIYLAPVGKVKVPHSV
jgi:SagB-type dehydrogenase family enzyme